MRATLGIQTPRLYHKIVDATPDLQTPAMLPPNSALHGTYGYGIPNCDTVKKARVWLGDKGQDFAFHDFRKDGLSEDMVTRWLAHGDG